jgi:hypothetical protein
MPVIKVRIEGADEVIRSLRKLPADTQDAMRHEARDIATSLADFIKADARRRGRQAAQGASSVREGRQGFWPVVTGSSSGKAKGLLFGSVFGMKRHSGWYARRRYHGSAGRQFAPYVGFPGYWFFSTAEKRQPWITSEWGKAGDEIVRRWGA